MKPYLVTYKFYYDGELLREGNYRQLREAPYEEEYSGTDFEGLWNLTNKYSIEIPLGMWEFKKGKRFLQYYGWMFKQITPKNCKPWKFVITSKEITISMERLMQFDTEDVIQYLKERGMTACPILK